MTAVVLLMSLSLQLIGNIFSIILLFLMALFLAIALNPIVTKIGRLLRIKKRGLATGIAFALVVLILSSLLAVTIRPVGTQVAQFFEDLPTTVESFTEGEGFLPELVTSLGLDSYISDASGNISQFFEGSAGDLFDVLKRISSVLGALIIVLIMSFMILLEGPAFVKQVKKLMPKEKSERWQRLSKEMNEVITGYITGQVIIAVIAGLFAMLFMTIFRVDNALPLAVIVAFCALIPLIGALLGAIIVVVLTLLVDVNLALLLAAYFFVYQQIENATIQPWIQGQQTNLSTLQVFIAALIGVKVAGFAGALLSVPIAACLKIIIIDYFKTNKNYIEKRYLTSSGSRRRDSG